MAGERRFHSTQTFSYRNIYFFNHSVWYFLISSEYGFLGLWGHRDYFDTAKFVHLPHFYCAYFSIIWAPQIPWMARLTKYSDWWCNRGLWFHRVRNEEFFGKVIVFRPCLQIDIKGTGLIWKFTRTSVDYKPACREVERKTWKEH